MKSDPLLLNLKIDLLENIIDYAGNIKKCGNNITSQIREIIGTRVVAFFERNPNGEYTLLSACPQRKGEIFEQALSQRLIAKASFFTQAVLVVPGEGEVGKIIAELGMRESFFVPLYVGDESYGMLVLLDLMDNQGIGHILHALRDISGLLSLVLKNSFLYRNMETLIEQRTFQLVQSESRSRIILQTAMDGFLRADTKGQLLEVNDAYCEMVGYSRSELLPMTISQLDAVESASEIDGRIRKVLDGQKSRFETKHCCKDGNFIDLEVCTQAFTEGSHSEIVVFLRDITERKRTEEALRRSETHLEEAQRIARVGSWEWVAATDTPTWSKELCRILGVDPGKLVPGMADQDKLYTPDSMVRMRTFAEKAMHTGEPYEIELEHVRENGSSCWLLARGERWYNEKREIIGLRGTALDVTERKLAEKKRKKLETQLANAMEIAQLGHWEYDVDQDLFVFNDQFYKIFRTTAEQVGGYCMSSTEYTKRFVHPEDYDLVASEIRKSIETTGPGFDQQLEHRILYADGKVGYITVRYFNFKNDRGKTVGLFGVNQDITARKEMESNLLQVQRLEAIGNLAGGIAHDFNNILFPIIGIAEMLKEDLPPSTPEHKNVNEILRAGRRGSRLVQQILAFGRQHNYQKIPVRLQRVAREVLKLCRSTIPANIEISHSLQPDCGLVLADSTQMHQIGMNLITNAYHAVLEAGGKIHLELREENITKEAADTALAPGKYAVLIVSDDGIGIKQENLDKIFEPYFTTKDQGKGTGLGLSVVYGIVKDHKGDIKVASKLGQGTSFHVYLPIIESSATDDTVNVEDNALLTGDAHVLLVDDEKAIANLGKHMLERLGYRVNALTSSNEALEAFRDTPDKYDLVMTDMAMPQMTGYELAAKIIQIRSDIPIIICTGFSEGFSEKNARAIGIKGFLGKPIIKADLAKEIQRVLEDK